MVNWTQEKVLLMLKIMMDVQDISPDFPSVAEGLTTALGEDVTARAVQHRFAAIRSIIYHPAPNPKKAAKTPKAPKAKAAPKPPKTPSTRKRAAAAMDVDDNDEQAASLQKKAKIDIGDGDSTIAEAGSNRGTPEITEAESHIAAANIKARRTNPASPLAEQDHA